MEEIVEYVQNELVASGHYKKLTGGIVLTGGGSQLQGVAQLFEYMTGLDTRIGYPNEHLGKCKIEEVKSPMYATSVGLVLAGFRSLDERENNYRTGQKTTLNQKFRPNPSELSLARIYSPVSEIN
jgi:cell division protein FtsA